MSNELTLAVSLSFKKGDVDVSFGKGGLKFDVTGTKFVHLKQSVGTSEEALDLGDLGTPGYCIMYNHDSTNYVDARPGTGENDLVRVPAGGLALFYIASAAPFVIANTASCELEFLIVEA